MTRFLKRVESFATEHPRTAIAYVMLISCLVVYLPFLGDLDAVARFYDGPLYIVVAKTFYCLSDEEAHSFLHVPARYYACHLPAYPLVVRVCSFFALGNYTIGLLTATILCAIAAAVLFHEVLAEFQAVVSPLWSSILFCFFPPRWLIYHSVGASEPLFLCFVFACFLAYKRNRPAWVALFICLASLTRIPGALLGPVFLVIYLMEGNRKAAFLMPLSGIGLLVLFWVYQVQFHDFYAYFSWNLLGEKLVRWPPLTLLFSHFNSGFFRESEYHLMLYGFYGLGTAFLWKHRPFFVYGLVYFIFTLFIHHSDVTRYFLSMAAIAVFIGYDRLFSLKPVRAVLLALIPFFYCYAWGYIPVNSMSPEDYHNILVFERR